MADSIYEKVFDLAKRRGFLYPAFELYGGAAGFYDYGPLGARLKALLEEKFRDLYVVQEGAVEINTPAITVEPVLKASGHVDHFSDVVLTCRKCGSGYRADHLIPEELGRIQAKVEASKAPDAFKKELTDLVARLVKEIEERPNVQTTERIRNTGLRADNDVHVTHENVDGGRFQAPDVDEAITCPTCGHRHWEPAAPFNLMFRTTVGPGSSKVAFMRPETAQAMFVDFPHLLRYFREKLPFAAVQIGRAYRNEISPRQGLIRLREFNQMEVEAFYDPKEVKEPGFRKVRKTVLNLVPNDTQTLTPTAIGDAVKKGTVSNAALGYHMVLVHRFLTSAGIDPQRLRFRQHLKDEMAHYANDCWDAEYESARFGWIECVGIADRGQYDVGQHAKHSGKPLTALRRFAEPVQKEVTRVVAVGAKLGPLFKRDAPRITEALQNLTGEEAAAAENAPHVDVDLDGTTVQVPRDAYVVERKTETVVGEPFIPHVIEPSYGTDRIMYGILEHNYRETQKEGETYTVLSLPPAMAPVTVAVFPLMAKDGMDAMARRIEQRLRSEGMHVIYDDTGSIGKRYARADEIGIPFCVTVDYESVEEKTVTLRDRDTTEQWRLPAGRVHREIQRFSRSGWVRPAERPDEPATPPAARAA